MLVSKHRWRDLDRIISAEEIAKALIFYASVELEKLKWGEVCSVLL